jgi:hypothetical protein
MKRDRRIRFSAILGISGFVLWLSAAALYFIPGQANDVSIGHIRVCALGVVAGGALVVGAIALFATSV